MLSELFSVVVRTNVLCNCYASDFKKKSQSCLGMQRSRLIFVLGGKQSHILINNKFNFCFKMSRTYCKQCLTDVQMHTFGRTLTKSCDSLKEQNWKALNRRSKRDSSPNIHFHVIKPSCPVQHELCKLLWELHSNWRIAAHCFP